MENPMNNFFFIPVSFVTALVVFGFAAKWYYWPWATRVSFKDAATPILLMNATRFIGLGFLVPGLVSSELSPFFSTAAAGGDMLAAGLALLALAMVRLELPGAKVAVWVATLEGFADFVDAYVLGFTYAKPELLQGMYFIPTFLAPLLMVSEVVLFGLLIRRSATMKLAAAA
jgi:hypothetical protein